MQNAIPVYHNQWLTGEVKSLTSVLKIKYWVRSNVFYMGPFWYKPLLESYCSLLANLLYRKSSKNLYGPESKLIKQQDTTNLSSHKANVHQISWEKGSSCQCKQRLCFFFFLMKESNKTCYIIDIRVIIIFAWHWHQISSIQELLL